MADDRSTETAFRLDSLDLCGYCNTAECGIDHSVEGCPRNPPVSTDGPADA